MKNIADLSVKALLASEPRINEFLVSLGLDALHASGPLGQWLAELPDEVVFDAGMERSQILGQVERLLKDPLRISADTASSLSMLTVFGGHDKSGNPEKHELILRLGEIVCVVGPTGSGKSRLLGDIECLAQGDTPTGRHVLLDGVVPDEEMRSNLECKLVAQLSQNMNFVVDLSVREFIGMHARCRMLSDPEARVDRVIACANELTGEKFMPEVAVTQLSGGQTRALMIADAALLSASPVVLIDEIENAGVDRRKAVDLLVTGHKIVVISTHDPLLALRGARRIVVRNGGIADILTTSELEQKNLESIEAVDAKLMDIRDRIRSGQRIEEELHWPT